MKIKIKTEGLTVEECGKVEIARQHIENCMNSEEFKQFIFNFNFNVTRCSGHLWWKKCTKSNYNRFHWNVGYDNKTIYDRVMSGVEVLSPVLDNKADISIKIDRRNKTRVLGYTYKNTEWQWIYKNFFNESSVYDIAGNIAHEYMHKMGFGHEYRWTPSRQYSVPYAIGYFIKDWRS